MSKNTKMLDPKEVVVNLPDGRTIRFETGRLAKQAAGAAVVQMDDAFLLSTVCFGPEKDADFFPLTVEYKEKAYAAGRLPGGYLKRESGRPSDEEILAARVIDRPIRPMFPENFSREVQVIVQALSADKKFAPDFLGVSVASLSIGLSELPFEEQVAAVRVAVVDGKPIVCPSYEEVAISDLDLVVAGTVNSVCMVEGGAYEVSEDVMIEAILAGHEVVKSLCKAQQELVDQCAKEKMPLNITELSEAEVSLKEAIREVIFEELNNTLHIPMVKTEHYPAMAALLEKVANHERVTAIVGEDEDLAAKVKPYFQELERNAMRQMILTKVFVSMAEKLQRYALSKSISMFCLVLMALQSFKGEKLKA